MNRHPSRFLDRCPPSLLAILGAVLFLFNSCSVGPDYVRPETEVPPGYKEAATGSAQGPAWKPAEPRDDAHRGRWWKIYNDVQLNALEEQVSISNQNLKTAEAQFRAARAAVGATRAAAFPTVSVAPSYTRSRASMTMTPSTGSSSSGNSGSSSGSTASPNRVRADYLLPLELSYVADVWGNIRRSVEQGTAAAQASFADLENARLSYQAELAQDWFNLHGLDRRRELLATTVASYQRYLDLTKDRYKSGIASRADVAQAETQIETARVQLIDVGIQRAQFEHAIAILVGKPPSEFSVAPAPLTALPPSIPAGVPSEMLERRPDIAGAERRVAAANAAIGVATSAFYPTLTLSASAGLESIELSKLFSGPSFLWSVGPVLAQTLFDAGKRHALAEEARANHEATVATYCQTVLTAFQQVEDNLAGLRMLEEEAVAQDAAVKASQEALAIATAQYKAGIQSYLQVIISQATALNEELNAINLRMRRMTTSVLLIEALGGGWDVGKLPSRHDASTLAPPHMQPPVPRDNE